MSPLPSRPVAPVRSLPALALALMRQWWRQLAALAAACAVVTATITGALGVGEAVTGGLRSLALERLGGIEAAVVADHGFDRRLAGSSADPTGGPLRTVPALVLEVAVAAADRPLAARATLLACDDLAALGFPPLAAMPAAGVLMNPPLAAALNAGSGEPVVLRIPTRSNVPADSPLGRRDTESKGRRLVVAGLLPDAGLGRFSLRPTQVTRPLVVTSLATAQAILREGDVVNTIFAVAAGRVSGSTAMPAAAAGGAAADWLAATLHPDLADLGLSLEPAAPDATSLRLAARRLILAAEVDRVADELLGPLGGRPTLVFLATALEPVENGTAAARASIPYSTVAGIDGTTLPVGDLVDESGTPLPPPGPDEILIDRWMADDLAAQGRPVAVGDRIRVTYFLPETLHGRVEQAVAEFRIAGVAAMQAAAVARDLVPEVEGVTDEQSIADWDPPFPFDQTRVRTTPPHDEDDRYWKRHGATPKAFIALETARRLAGSRFGVTTTWHVPRARVADPDGLRRRLAAAIRPEALGMRVLPLRAEALAAARGSTPFGSLFLALSSFVVAAGLLLVTLLFGLLVSAHRRDVGLLAAIGWPPGRLAQLLLAVGAAAALIGVAVGTVIGPLWTSLLLTRLSGAWNTEVARGSTAAFTAAPPALVALLPGAIAAVGVSLAALTRVAWRSGSQPPLVLLRGTVPPTAGTAMRRGRLPGAPWSRSAARRGDVRPAKTSAGSGMFLAGGCAAAAVVCAALAALFLARGADPAVVAGLFFAAGFAALGCLLVLVRRALAGGGNRAGSLQTLFQLARRGLAHQPARAFSVAAIVACAEFLIVAVSAFAVRPPANPADRRSPTGGWSSIVTFDPPTSVDPASADVRAGLGLSATQEQAVAGCELALVRANGGDDASCANLYATNRPTVLGVGPAFIRRGGFSFVAAARSADATSTAAGNPWALLESMGSASATAGEPIPAVLDQATAQWGLKLGGVGARFTLADDAGRPVELEIVGLLEPGILQGFVIVSEKNFERMFPARSGYGVALIDTSRVATELEPQVQPALAAAWADAGASFTVATERLRRLQAVQNTFLGGFQALGTLGLLLGTAGVAAVQLQGLAERLGSLSVLRAIGFSLTRLRGLLVLETVVTVGLGLAAGTAAGCLAVTPMLAGAAARLPLRWIVGSCGLTLAAALLAGMVAASRGTIPERPRAE